MFYYKALQRGETARVVPIDKFNILPTIVLAFVYLAKKSNFGDLLAGSLVVAEFWLRFT
jgi:transporter family protein